MATPALRPELEVSLHLAVLEAARRGHPYAGLEHLLFALLHDDATAATIEAAGARADRLRRRLERYLDEELRTGAGVPIDSSTPTLAFRRAVQQAALQALRSGREEVTGAHVLVAMWDEEDSFAVHFLQEAGADRMELMRRASAGVPEAVPAGVEEDEEE
ncbi:MAG TPA: Clp protease N-terminal domain-containing protein, partial [Archangium sp.]